MSDSASLPSSEEEQPPISRDLNTLRPEVEAKDEEDEYNFEDESEGEEAGAAVRTVDLAAGNLEGSDDEEVEQEPMEKAAASIEGGEKATPSTRGPKGDSERTQNKSMASAFAEILAHPGPANKRDKAPILLGSKSVGKRQREEQEEAGAQRAAKKLRQDMKQRGHEAVPTKGAKPEHDALEKVLLKIATRGVVQLFNAVSKAQKRQTEALAAGTKTQEAKISKASFFSELKGQAAKGLVPLLSPKRATPVGASAKDLPGGKQTAAVTVAASGQPRLAKGWDVLEADFAGLEGGGTRTKMKDWDKQDGSDSAEGDAISGSDSEGLGDW